MADVKKKIAEEKGDDYAVELQKLIYNGKVSAALIASVRSKLQRNGYRFSTMPQR